MVDISECAAAPESVPAHPDPASVSPDVWRCFEAATVAVVNKIQPTTASEQLRAAVVDYVQRLFCFQARYQIYRAAKAGDSLVCLPMPTFLASVVTHRRREFSCSVCGIIAISDRKFGKGKDKIDDEDITF